MGRFSYSASQCPIPSAAYAVPYPSAPHPAAFEVPDSPFHPTPIYRLTLPAKIEVQQARFLSALPSLRRRRINAVFEIFPPNHPRRFLLSERRKLATISRLHSRL